MECVRSGRDTSLRHALPHAAPKMQMAPAGSCMATLSQRQHVGEITVTVAKYLRWLSACSQLVTRTFP